MRLILAFTIFSIFPVHGKIHQNLMTFVQKAQTVEHNVNDGAWLVGHAPSISCDAISLRLKRYRELQGEFKILEDLIGGSLRERIFTHGKIVLFISDQSHELYDLLIDTSANKANINLTDQNIDATDFSFIVLGHEAKLRFGDGYGEYALEDGVLTFPSTNYQACANKYMDLYIVQDCKMNTFTGLSKCFHSKVLHYQFKIPTKNIREGIIRKAGDNNEVF